MVADTLVYHPAVSHYLKFVATTVGRDKLLRTIQYFARFYAWYLLRTNRPQTSIAPWEVAKKQFGLIRKVLRVGKNIEHLKAASVAADSKTLDPVLRYTAVGRQLGYAGYLTFDLGTVLDATGIKKSPRAKNLQQQAYRCWAVGITFSLIAQLYTLRQLRLREAKVDRKEGEGVLEAKRIALERKASQLQLTSDLCDLTVPLSALNWVALDDGVVGLAGTLSSLIGVYLQWKKTAHPSLGNKHQRIGTMAIRTNMDDLNLSILGLGTQYPPHSLKPDSIEVLSKRFYPESPAMNKVLSINRCSGIEFRSSIGTHDHPIMNQPDPPTIAESSKVFMKDGVPLAISAARKALAEARVNPDQVTHMVSTTCTNSANPGYDHFVAQELGLSPNTEKVLLHGVGCSGGLAALRTAANLCLGHTARGKPARILVVALEISTTMGRSELESIHTSQETRIGIALFSDCGGALLLSNNIPFPSPTVAFPVPPIYSLLGWHHHTIPSTTTDLGFDIDPVGWKVVLSPRVPQIAESVLAPTFSALLSSLAPSLTAAAAKAHPDPTDFDWALHPGGATILTGAERVLGLSSAHLRASYDTYINHGNSSSATIISVLDRLRQKDMDALAEVKGPKEMVVGCAFGPGITVEMCMLKRNLGGHGQRRGGIETPPETESEGDERSADGEWEDSVNGKEEEEDVFVREALEQVELD
ncbi:peroxisomal biogenesis factor 11-domain-containing protein [Dichotomopilus funicola]|uniref:Peroxisomal biogenesis factor 11-domain-containing protein n=1 Tax=Dichotomopilus funicola TaxID=1934379 RepID=A0AAN6V5L7_9PEZI|nr:peroxisomal biogenesis factor 11-domain-containing protein [Dichotomopilus funicola]